MAGISNRSFYIIALNGTRVKGHAFEVNGGWMPVVMYDGCHGWDVLISWDATAKPTREEAVSFASAFIDDIRKEAAVRGITSWEAAIAAMFAQAAMDARVEAIEKGKP